MKKILIQRVLSKSRIKAHTRRTARGVVQVREHDDRRSKQLEQPTRRQGASSKATNKSGTNSIQSAAPVAAGQFLEGKGIPISNAETKINGIAVSKKNGKTVIEYHRHSNRGGKKAAIKIMNQVKEALEEQSLTISQIGSSDSFIIHQSETDGLKDLPKKLREKVQRDTPGKGSEITLTKDEITTLLSKGRVGFISAGKNPNSTSTDELGLSEQDVNDRSDNLRKELVTKGLKYIKVEGKYGEEDDAFMVMILDAKHSEIVAMGQKYNQDSVIYSDHNKNEMIYTTGENTGSHGVGEGFKYLDNRTADFYSEITTRSGSTIKFTLNFNFDNTEPVEKAMRKKPQVLIKARIKRSKKSSTSQKQSMNRYEQVQQTLRKAAMEHGLKFHRNRIKGANTNTLKRHLADAQRSQAMGSDTIMWLKSHMNNDAPSLAQWATYKSKTAPDWVVKEYKGFWGKAIDLYTAEIEAVEKGFRLTSLIPGTSFVAKSVTYSMEKDKSCADDEFYLLHPKSKKRYKVKIGKPEEVEVDAPKEMVKSWSTSIMKQNPGARWVTVIDGNSTLKDSHILIMPHKNGTASIIWAPEQVKSTLENTKDAKGKKPVPNAPAKKSIERKILIPSKVRKSA